MSCIGIGLAAMFTGRIKCRDDIFCLPHISHEDMPPMPPVKSPRKDNVASDFITIAFSDGTELKFTGRVIDVGEAITIKLRDHI